MRMLSITLLGLLILATPVAAAPGDETPSWVQQAASMKVPTYDKEVPAVVLISELTTNVSSDGKTNEVMNYAIRVLRREGRDYAYGRVGYIPESSKVKDFRAWLIRPNGETKRYGKDDTVDVAAQLNDVYNEYRYKRIAGEDDADTGAVFAFTYTLEDKSIFTQSRVELPDLSTGSQLAIQPHTS